MSNDEDKLVIDQEEKIKITPELLDFVSKKVRLHIKDHKIVISTVEDNQTLAWFNLVDPPEYSE